MKRLGKFLCVIGEILAIVLVLALLLYHINGIYNFMPKVGADILNWIFNCGTVLLVCLIALGGVMQTRSIILTILVALFIAALIGFTFYRGAITNFLPQAKGSTETAIAALIA